MLRTIEIVHLHIAAGIGTAMLMIACACSRGSAAFETRIYTVDDSFWSYIVTNPDRFPSEVYDDELAAAGVKQFLVSMGVAFSEGAFISFSRKDNHIVARNLPEDLDKIESIFDPMKGDRRFFIKCIVE